jgi:hypothetical protein
MSVAGKVAQKSMNRLTGVLAGALAGAVFSRIWRAVADSDEAPAPDSPDHRTREVLLAAVLQGAVFSLVKAALERTITKRSRRRAQPGSGGRRRKGYPVSTG